jgi:cytochrome c oxidase subunit IV
MAKRGTGWIGFAGVVLIIAGAFDIVSGLWALDNKESALDAVLYESNLETWGWIYLIVGIVILVAGFAVFGRAQWARWVGVLAAMLGILVEFFWMFQTPGRSLLYIVIALLVIYALVVYGDREFDATGAPPR